MIRNRRKHFVYRFSEQYETWFDLLARIGTEEMNVLCFDKAHFPFSNSAHSHLPLCINIIATKEIFIVVSKEFQFQSVKSENSPYYLDTLNLLLPRRQQLTVNESSSPFSLHRARFSTSFSYPWCEHFLCTVHWNNF